MKKSKKSRRINCQKKALRQRISDIYSGVVGSPWTDDFATAECLSKVAPVLMQLFGNPDNDYLWKLHNLVNFQSVDSATEFLFRNGVRA